MLAHIVTRQMTAASEGGLCCMELVSLWKLPTIMVTLKNNRSVAYPGIFFFWGGVSTSSVEDRENGDLGVAAP
jgi:hypothetical protein